MRTARKGQHQDPGRVCACSFCPSGRHRGGVGPAAAHATPTTGSSTWLSHTLQTTEAYERHGVDASMDGSMDGWTDGCSGRIDRWIDGRMDGEVVDGRIVSRIAVRTSMLHCLAYRMYRCRCYRKEFFLRNITQYFLFIIIVTITAIIL